MKAEDQAGNCPEPDSTGVGVSVAGTVLSQTALGWGCQWQEWLNPLAWTLLPKLQFSACG